MGLTRVKLLLVSYLGQISWDSYLVSFPVNVKGVSRKERGFIQKCQLGNLPPPPLKAHVGQLRFYDHSIRNVILRLIEILQGNKQGKLNLL